MYKIIFFIYINLSKKFDKFKEHISPIKVPSITDIQDMLDIVFDRSQTYKFTPTCFIR